MNAALSTLRKKAKSIFGVTPAFVRSLSRNLALAALAAVGLGETRAASNLTWDPGTDGDSIIGGAGTWDTTNAFWDPTGTDALVNNQIWNNLNNDTAIFGGTGGAVTVGVPITAGGLVFNSAGYTLSGSALTLTGTATVNTLADATLSNVIAGAAGLTKTGTALLNVSGNNTYVGGTTISAGTLNASYTNGQTALGSGTIHLSGSTLSLTPTAGTVQGLSGRQFTSSAAISDTARIDFTGTANSVRVDGPFALTQANNLVAPTAAQWTGKVNITTGGAYTFVIGSDDGSRLFIDGVLVVQNDGPKGVLNGTSAAINLSSGMHDIRMDFVNSGGNGNLNLNYSGPDQPVSAAIPVTNLFQAETNTVASASNAVILGSGIGNDLDVAGNSTIALQGSAFTQTQLGNAVFNTGSTLNLTSTALQTGKSLRLAGTTNFGNGVTLNLAGDGTNGASLFLDGVVSDGGSAVTISKQGNGRLVFDQTAAANSLLPASTIDVQGGALVAVGSSAAGAFNPLGAATVKLSGGGLVLDSKVGSLTAPTVFANNINVTANGTLQAISTGGSLTNLTGTINLGAGSTLTLDPIAGGNPATSLGALLNVNGSLTGSGNVNVISSRVGTLTITPTSGVVFLNGNNAGYTGTISVSTNGILQASSAAAVSGVAVNLSGGTLNLLNDGNGTGALESIALNPNLSVSAASTLTVGRLGTTFAPLFPLAANKTIQAGTLNTAGSALTVNNLNGYGLDVTGTTTLSVADQPLSVTTATASNLVPGLTLSGQVTGAFGLIKQGVGSLALTNAGNTFGGAGKLIDITGGILAASSDGALGDAANGVRLNIAGATGVGFRATGTFGTSRTFTLNQATNAIEVSAGNTFALNSALAGLTATTQLVKNDTGTLVLNAANPGTWTASITGSPQVLTGGMLVNQGIVRITNPAALGATTNIIAVNSIIGAAVEIGGGITVPNPLVLNTQTTNGYASGINWAGDLHSIGNGVTNTWSGAISENQDGGISADAGNTLNLTGGITQNAHIVVYGGAGTINVTTNPILTVHSLDKIGSGTLNIQVATAGPTGNGIRIFGGNLTLSGAGAVTGGGTVQTIIEPGASLTLDNSGTVLANRLGPRTIQFLGGNLNLIGGATVANEAMAAPTFNRGQSTITVTGGAGGANLTFTAASNNVAPAQTTAGSGATALFRGTSLGTAAGAGIATIQSTTGGFVFNGQTGATGTTNKGILPWALIDTTTTGLGTSFATGDAAAATNTTAILRPLAAGEYSTATTLAANANMLITTALAGQNTVAPNSLTIDTGGSVAMNSLQTLTLSSGGILVRNGVASTISGGILSAPGANSPWSIHTPGTASLVISSLMTAGNTGALNSNVGLVKAGDGVLTLSTPTNLPAGLPTLSGLSANTLNMQTVVNQGTLRLAGGTNTLATNNFLEVSAGGTLDLNGTSQYVSGLFTDGVYNGIPNAVTAGGTVTSTAPAVLVTNSDGRNWAGTITGNIFYNRTGTATATTIYAPQTYTGGTLINGGTVSLRDYGSLATTSGISLNYAQLTLDNTQAASISGRVGTVPITMRGGTFLFQGRAQTDSTESIGAVSFAEGWNNLTALAGGTNVNSAVLTVASLSRPAGATAIVNFAQAAGGAAANGQLGSTPRLMVTTAPVLSNNIIGAWAINSREWASYLPGLGEGSLNATGFAGYATNVITGTPLATDNIRTTTGFTLTGSGTLNINTLNFNTTTTQTADLGGRTLNLGAGGLLVGLSGDNTTTSVNNGTLTSGLANGSVNDLYVYDLPYGGTNRQLAIGAVVANNGATPVRLIVSSSEGVNSAQRTTLNGLNTYTGGTVVNQGTLVVGATGTLPAGGITLNNGALSEQVPGQATPGVINSSNIVTLNGSSSLNFAGTNTIAGLVFNNNGGAATQVVNSFIAGVGPNGTGTLTIGASGVTASSSNVQTTATMVGRFDFGATNTITVNPIMVNGVNVAPLQAALAIQGWVGSGTVTKTGNGVLQLNAQQVFTGTLNVAAGGLAFGSLGNTGLAAGNAAGSRLSTVNLAANTFLNLNNTDSTLGSLTGSGTVINVAGSGGIATARTFNWGADNNNSTFSGSFVRWSDAFPNPYQINKIGTGTVTLTGVSNDTGNLQVSQGGVTFSGTGAGVFGTNIILPTATLTLDNSGTNLANRLGGATNLGTLTVGGGNFRIVGNASAPTTETIGTVNLGVSAGNLYGTPVVTLAADPAQPLTFTVGTTWGGIPIGSSSLIRGISGTAGNGLANFSLGAIALGVPTGSGTGVNGTTTMGIRPDILGDASVSGTGTGFIVKDSATNFLRPLAASELANTLPSGTTAATVNYGLASSVSTSARTTVGSLTLNSGGGVLADPGLSSNTRDGLPTGLVVNTGGILAFAGNTGITVGRLETANNLAFHFHTQADLNVNAVLFNTNNGLNKGEAGTLTLNARNLYTGQTQVNAGTLKLNGGDNTLPLFLTAGAPTTTPLGVNSSTAVVDFNGTNQITGTINNNTSARYTGSGGTFTNTSATPSTFTTILGSVQVFGGSLTGNLNFNKTGNNALSFSNVNTYTGATTVRANTLTLIDAGTLSGTSAVNLNYGALALDQSGLNPVGNVNPTRIPATTPINLRGATVTLTGGGSIDSAATFNTVNVLEAHNTLSVPQAPLGATNALTIGNLARAGNPDATVNFTGGAGGFLSNFPGLNQSNLYINSIDGTPIPATIPGKILGGWALANNGEFVTYISPTTTGSNGQNFGIVTMNGTTGPLGTITQSLYDATVVTAAGTATTNVRLAAAGTLVAGGTTYNSLAMRTATTTLSFTAATDVLNLASGGLALTAGTNIVGATVGSGVLTSGGASAALSRLYIYGSTSTINSVIANSGVGGASTRLVLVPLAGANTIAGVNTYTGGTVINGAGGTVTFSSASSSVPAGGLTLNNATATSTVAGNIAASNDVTLNGGSSLTLTGANTLNSLSFNNTGGTANPTVAVGATSLTLTATNAITAVNDNVATVPTISGTLLTLPSGANISASTTVGVPTDLVISAPIASAGSINKTGNGSLDLSATTSTFAGGVNLTAGTLILGASSTPTTGTVTSGPLGTGTLTVSGGTAILSDTAIRTVANAITLNGDVTLGTLNGVASAAAVNGVILSGPVALGSSAARTISVNSLLNSSTISGIVSGSGSSVIKTGPGTLVLTGANTYDGGTAINGGILQSNSTGLGTTGAITFGGGVLQHAGATATDFSARFSTANNQPFYIDTNNQTITYASALTSATGGSLGKFGLGTLVLTNTATYDGATIINAGTLQIGAGGTVGDIPNATNISDNGVLLWNRSDADSLTGIISGAGSITKQGPGGLTLSGVNTFTGNVTMSSATPNTSGSITITNSQALGVGPKTITVVSNTVSNGAQLVLDGSAGNITLAANLSFNTSQGSLTQPAIRNIAGDNVINGNFTLNSGGGSTSIAADGGTLNLTGTFTPNTTLRELILLGTTAGGTFSGLLQDGSVTNTAALRKEGVGTWSLTNLANTYTAATTINGGTLSVSKLANGGVVSSIGASTNVAASLVLNGGTLKYTGAGDSTNRQFTLGTNGGTLDASGSGPVAFTSTSSPVFSTPGVAEALTLTGSSTDANTFAAPLTDNGVGATSLTKAGAGNWIVSGAHAFTGLTTVQAGQLNLTGSLTGSALVSGGLLTGTGSINGAAVNVNGGALNPGVSNGPGMLTVGGASSAVTFGGGTFAVDLSGSSVAGTDYDQLHVTGATGTFSLTANTPLTIALGAGYNPLTDGSAHYTIMSLDNTSPAAASYGAFAFTTQGGVAIADDVDFIFAGRTWQLNYNGGSDQNDLILTAVPEPGSALLLLGGLGSLLGLRRARRKQA